ncbi:MAG: NAD(P)H-hydrate epimerase [Alkalibacterium sp.]|nr:NAD(P)H-hydrate epimerase [Alkalibacterium sp.]
MGDGLSAREIKAIDHFTIHTVGIPSLVLMERAALSVTEAILKEYDYPEYSIVCGTGNNGGDGIAVGRLLHQSGKQVTLLLVGDFDKASKETKTQLSIARHLRIPVKAFPEEGFSNKNALIVDALFGIGLNRDVKQPQLAAVRTINESSNHVIAVDIPSGLSADTGLIYNEAVKAEKTYTIGFWKKGFDNPLCRQFTGEIDVLLIGYPPESDYLHVLESEKNND